MTQHDFNVADQGFPAFRADMNLAFLAGVSLSSGASEPSTKFAYQWWADTTANVLKQRNSANNAWIIRGSLDIMGVLAKTANYTVVIADFGKIIVCDASGDAFTITLPVAATAADGFVISIKKTDSSPLAVTVDGDSAETIDGVTTLGLLNQHDAAVLRCDGAGWFVESRAGVDDWQVIASGTVSAAASLDFTDLSATYRAYKLVFSNLLPATDGVALTMRTDTNNGVSFEAGASDYDWAFVSASATASVSGLGDNADTAIQLSGSVSFTAGNESSGHVLIIDPMNGATQTGAEGSQIFVNSTGNATSIHGGGHRLADEVNNAIQFLFTSGNITTMTYTLYGMRAS